MDANNSLIAKFGKLWRKHVPEDLIPNQDQLVMLEPIEHFLQVVVSLARHVTATDRRWWWPSETLCTVVTDQFLTPCTFKLVVDRFDYRSRNCDTTISVKPTVGVNLSLLHRDLLRSLVFFEVF